MSLSTALLLSCCFSVSSVACAKLHGVSNNTGGAAPTVIQHAADSLLRFFRHDSTDSNVFAVMSRQAAAVGSNDISVFAPNGELLAGLNTYSASKTVLQLYSMLEIVISTEAAFSSRWRVQNLFGLTVSSVQESNVRRDLADRFFASTAIPDTSQMVVCGDELRKRLVKVQMDNLAFGSRLLSPDLAFTGRTVSASLSTGNSLLVVSGQFASVVTLQTASLASPSYYPTGGLQTAFSFVDSLRDSSFFALMSDASLRQFDLALSVASQLAALNPPLQLAGPALGHLNLGSLALLALADTSSSKLTLISKASLTIQATVEFLDATPSLAAICGGWMEHSKVYFSRIEAGHGNFQVFYLQTDLCSQRAADSKCQACAPDAYFLVDAQLQKECISPADAPQRFGPNPASGYIEPCQDPNCLSCQARVDQCKACDSSNQFYLHQAVCHSIATIPQGFGLDLTSSEFKACDAGARCQVCAANWTHCEVCNQQAGFYRLEDDCLSTSEAPTGFGLNTQSFLFEQCLQADRCSDCSQDSKTCSSCFAAGGFYLFLDSCLKLHELPDRTGLDIASKRVKLCADPNCLDCKEDTKVCKHCDSATGFFNLRGACRSPDQMNETMGLDLNTGTWSPCSTPGCSNCTTNYLICNSCQSLYILDTGKCLSQRSCQPKIKSSEFDPASQTAELRLDSSANQSLFKDYQMEVSLQHSDGKTERLEEVNDYSIKEISNRVQIRIKLQKTIYAAAINFDFFLKRSSTCDRETSTNLLQHAISPITLLSATQDIAVLVDSSAGVLAFGTMAGSLLLFGISPTAAGTLCKTLVHSYWLMLIGGPSIIYPDLIFKAVVKRSQNLLLSGNFGWIGRQNKKFEDCNVPPRYKQVGVTCRLIESNTSEILLTMSLLALTSVVSLIAAKANRSALQSAQTKNSADPPKSVLARLAGLLERVSGIQLFITLLIGNSMKIMTHSSTVLLSSSTRPTRAFGKFSAFFLLSMYCCLGFLIWIFINEKKSCVQLAIKSSKKPGKKSQKKKLTDVFDIQEPGMMQLLAFMYRDKLLPRLQSSMQEPVVDILRCLCMPLAAYLTASHELTQMLMCVILQLIYTLITFRNRSLHSLLSFCFQASGTWLEMLYCVLKVVTLMDINERTRQQIIGPAMATILICLILGHLGHFVYCLAASVFEKQKLKRKKAEIISKAQKSEGCLKQIDGFSIFTQRSQSPSLQKKNSISLKRKVALISKDSAKAPSGGPLCNKRLLLSAACSPDKVNSRIRQDIPLFIQNKKIGMDSKSVGNQSRISVMSNSPLIALKKLSDNFNKPKTFNNKAPDIGNQIEQSMSKKSFIKLTNKNLSPICKNQLLAQPHENNGRLGPSHVLLSRYCRPPALHTESGDVPLLTAQSQFDPLLNSSTTASARKHPLTSQMTTPVYQHEKEKESKFFRFGQQEPELTVPKTVASRFKTKPPPRDQQDARLDDSFSPKNQV